MKAAQQQRADAVWLSVWLSNVSERLPRDVEEADSKFRIGWSMADSNRRPLACQRSGRPCRAYSTGTERDAQHAHAPPPVHSADFRRFHRNAPRPAAAACLLRLVVSVELGWFAAALLLVVLGIVGSVVPLMA